MLKLLDPVISRIALPAQGEDAAVRVGDVGTVVDMGQANGITHYMVEFCDEDGQTLAMPTFTVDQIQIQGSAQPQLQAA